MSAAIFPAALAAAPVDRSFTPSYEVRFGTVQADRAVYLRRRLVAGLVFVALCAAIGMSAHSVLADHGGVPASTPVVPPAVLAVGAAVVPASAGASAAALPSPGLAYLVQPGDTIWSIAQVWHGSVGLADYVERLVDTNGGAALQAGQMLTLP